MGSGVVLRVDLESSSKLVLSAPVFASGTQDQAPHDPALRVIRCLLHTLADFLDSLDDIAFFKLREGPVHVRVMILAVVLLGLATNVQGLMVDHVDVEQEGEVVISIGVFLVKMDALLEVLDCVLVVSNLEVSKADVVMELGVI